MVNTLSYAHFSSSLVCHGAKGERQSRESFVHLDKEGSRTFHLKVVDLLKLTLEDSATRFVLTRLSFSRGNINIEANHITRSELELSNVVARSGPVDNHVIAVNDMSFDLVRENTFDSIALELLGYSLDNICDFSICGSLCNFALGRLEGIPCSQNDISLTPIDGPVAYNNSGCSI